MPDSGWGDPRRAAIVSMVGRQARHVGAVEDARLDGLITGFCWGVVATTVAWMVLSGVVVRWLAALATLWLLGLAR